MTEKKEVEIVVTDPFVQMVERISANPDIDADKTQKFLDMQMQIMDRQAEMEFNASFNQVQKKLPTVVENCDNNQTKSKYANIKALSVAIKPIYTAEGFSTSFSEGKAEVEGHIRINGVLRHTGGHKEPYSVELPRDDAGIKGTVNKTPTHAASSTLTYGRRILTLMIFDVATGDDTDGNTIETTISDEHIANLEALLSETDTKKSDFCRYCKVKTLDDILSRNYRQAVAALEAKRV